MRGPLLLLLLGVSASLQQETLVLLIDALKIRHYSTSDVQGNRTFAGGAWSSCSATCGLGTRRRGAETSTCDAGFCPLELGGRRIAAGPDGNYGLWDEWGVWGPCSSSCGQGTRRRRRSCGLGVCGSADRSVQTEACLVSERCDAPRVSGGWGPWGAWGACSASCGQGTMTRVRPCPAQANCPGLNGEALACAMAQCTAQPQGTFGSSVLSLCWGPWGAWSKCSAFAGSGTGIRGRHRRCRCSTAKRCDAQQSVNYALCPFKQPDAYVVISLTGTGAAAAEEVVELCAYVIRTLILEVEEDEFHAYVQPTDPKWDAGRKTYAISSAKGFRDVAKSLDRWLRDDMSLNLDGDTIQVVIENSKTFSSLIRSQCTVLGLGLPWWARQWVNLRKEFRDVYGIHDPVERITFLGMIKDSGLKFEGKKESSWDLAFNAALLAAHLLKKGRLFKHLDANEDL